MPTKDAVLAVARSFLNIREVPSGSNRTRIGVEFGWNGQPWCAMAVSLALINAGFSVTKNAGADELGAELLNKYHWPRVSSSNLTSGDVIVFTFSHIGIVEARKDAGHVITFEGNHLDRDMRVVRANSSIRYGVRPPYSAAKEAPKVTDTSHDVHLEHGGNNTDMTAMIRGSQARHNAYADVQVPPGSYHLLPQAAKLVGAYLNGNAAKRAALDKLVP